ncbi:MAG TPA: 23S rRNA (adenine(2503)-C(2))-methyltransferase RlmN [Acidimicrobiales bacterium]|nr:MAG: 23S rRNA (adenine(2503)-C(2))-methyltransferase [Actinobacteria bacterium 21-73-9]HQU26394.1 23S rRNA (adenine(2503)-C(2))-methyltransferase RlmN [Acidimicrobiales bacterium]
MTSLYGLTRDELAGELVGEPRYRADQLWRGLWAEGRTLAEVTTIPRAVRERLAEAHPAALTPVEEVVSDRGGTRKWLFGLGDGATIETVLMHYDDRVTVCVSSQAGCAMGCTFCATGQAGFTRHLTLGEVLEQVMVARREARPARLSNVVFMGMGEPLANYAVTVGAVRRLAGDVGLSARHLTVSTVGVAPAIERLAAEGLPVTLALSLHAANDAARDELVPLNRRYPLERLFAACTAWVERTGRRLSLEWALIEGVNDTDAALGELVEFAAPLRAHVNLIPLNPTPGYLVRGSAPERVTAFRDGLVARGVNATVRNTRGRSIAAACGQLAQVSRGRRVAIRGR